MSTGPDSLAPDSLAVETKDALHKHEVLCAQRHGDIDTRLTVIEASLQSVGSTVDRNGRLVDTMGQQASGIDKRLALIEQRMNTFSWAVKTAAAGVIVLVIEAAWFIVKTGG